MASSGAASAEVFFKERSGFKIGARASLELSSKEVRASSRPGFAVFAKKIAKKSQKNAKIEAKISI